VPVIVKQSTGETMVPRLSFAYRIVHRAGTVVQCGAGGRDRGLMVGASVVDCHS